MIEIYTYRNYLNNLDFIKSLKSNLSLKDIKRLALKEAKNLKYDEVLIRKYPNLFNGLYLFIDNFIPTKKIFGLYNLLYEFIDIFLCDNKNLQIAKNSQFHHTIRFHTCKYLGLYVKIGKLEKFSKRAYKILK